MKVIRLVFKYLLAALFIFAGIRHFIEPDFYRNIMPDYIPYPELMVYLSGFTEVVAGILLAIPPLSHWGAWFIIAHLVAFFSVHFWMIQQKELYLSEDITIEILWLRVVLQVVFIVWAYWFTTQPKSKS